MSQNGFDLLYEYITSDDRSIVKMIIFILTFFILFTLLSLPTNVGFTFYFLIFSTVISYFVWKRNRERDNNFSLLALNAMIIIIFLLISMFTAPIVFNRIDNAEYFDDQLNYMEEGDLPFYHRINGSELRVVDKDLAISIMDKTNPFGSNKAVYSVHLGNYEGRLHWIGAVIFDGLILSGDNNRVEGFLAVDITDPTKEPIVIEQEFMVESHLIAHRDLARSVWFNNIRYQLGENFYFSFNDQADRMELVVPYSIQDHTFLGDSHGGLVTSDMELDGGVLIFGPNGEIINNYKDRTKLPKHARIQSYSETWLEEKIDKWGKSLVADNDVRWSTVLPWVKSERKLGVDDDVRVVINPDVFQPVQYILLDSTDSTNQILRGAIKANESGLHYYNWEKYQFIDTNSAYDHIEETIVNIRQTSTHGYKVLLPILYPIRDNVTTLRDYAYVMPLQLGESRFGGIAITDPNDKTGTRTIVEFVESGQNANVSETVEKAIDRYTNLIDNQSENNTDSDVIIGDFTITKIVEYTEDGNTVYLMEGNFSEFNDTIRVKFTQDFITSEEQWFTVVFAEIGDILNIEIELSEGVYYCVTVSD